MVFLNLSLIYLSITEYLVINSTTNSNTHSIQIVRTLLTGQSDMLSVTTLLLLEHSGNLYQETVAVTTKVPWLKHVFIKHFMLSSSIIQ